MKKMVLSLALLVPFYAQAESLKHFSDIATAVSKGKKLSFVMNFANCDLENSPQIVASIRPNDVMIIKNSRITTSERHFTINNPAFPGTAVYDYIKINITTDDNAVVNITTLNASDFSQLRSIDTNCPLNEGLKVYE